MLTHRISRSRNVSSPKTCGARVMTADRASLLNWKVPETTSTEAISQCAAALCIYSAIKCQNHFYHWTFKSHIETQRASVESSAHVKRQNRINFLPQNYRQQKHEKNPLNWSDTESIDKQKLIYGIFISCDCLGCYTCNLLRLLSSLIRAFFTRTFLMTRQHEETFLQLNFSLAFYVRNKSSETKSIFLRNKHFEIYWQWRSRRRCSANFSLQFKSRRFENWAFSMTRCDSIK